jgi:hypothetical protein
LHIAEEKAKCRSWITDRIWSAALSITVFPDAPGYTALVYVMGHELRGRGATRRIALWDLNGKLNATFRPVQEVREEISRLSQELG